MFADFFQQFQIVVPCRFQLKVLIYLEQLDGLKDNRDIQLEKIGNNNNIFSFFC